MGGLYRNICNMYKGQVYRNMYKGRVYRNMYKGRVYRNMCKGRVYRNMYKGRVYNPRDGCAGIREGSLGIVRASAARPRRG